MFIFLSYAVLTVHTVTRFDIMAMSALYFFTFVAHGGVSFQKCKRMFYITLMYRKNWHLIYTII